jgi:hypothetical protein
MPALTSTPQIVYAEARLDQEDGSKVGIVVKSQAYFGSQRLQMVTIWSQVPNPLPVDWWEDFGMPDMNSSWTDEGYTLPV